jgi:glycosyltransferase involved in cell wall biosynthesis
MVGPLGKCARLPFIYTVRQKIQLLISPPQPKWISSFIILIGLRSERIKMPKAQSRPHADIAVVIPCYNEIATIAKVVGDFHRELPAARIIVFDNNSTDGSGEAALAASAEVIPEKRQGKGFVVSAIPQKVKADFYVLVDGDDTYPAEKVHELLQPVLEGKVDMSVGQRLTAYSDKAFRPMHYRGNQVICWLINAIFHSNLKDPMSGYRVFNRSVALEIPIVSTGFDVETEMTLQMLYRHFQIVEIEIPYRERPAGSASKLHTFRDGSRVLFKIFSLLQSYKPLTFYGGIGLVLVFVGLIFGAFVIQDYILYQYIYRVPMAVLATGLVLVGFILGVVGIILTRVNYRLLEISNIQAKILYLIDQNSDPDSGGS